MSNTIRSHSNAGQPKIYQIRIMGHLGPQWSDWFAGMAITPQENGDTCVTGPVTDQAELHGLLRKIQDLGIPLISFMCLDATNDDVVDERAYRAERHETEVGP